MIIYTREKKEVKKRWSHGCTYIFIPSLLTRNCHSHILCFWRKVFKYCSLPLFLVCNYPAFNIIDSNNSYLLYNTIIYFIYFYCLSYTDATCCGFLHWGLSVSWLMQVLGFSVSLNKFLVLFVFGRYLLLSLFFFSFIFECMTQQCVNVWHFTFEQELLSLQIWRNYCQEKILVLESLFIAAILVYTAIYITFSTRSVTVLQKRWN